MELPFLHPSSVLAHTDDQPSKLQNLCLSQKHPQMEQIHLLNTEHFETPMGGRGEYAGERVTSAFYHHRYLSHNDIFFFEVNITYTDTPRSQVHNSINFEKSIGPCNQHPNQNLEHAHQAQKVCMEPF